MSSTKKPDQLIKMINQIGKNMRAAGELDEVAMEVASHIKRFWTPDMINKISRYASADGEELSDISALAINKLAG